MTIEKRSDTLQFRSRWELEKLWEDTWGIRKLILKIMDKNKDKNEDEIVKRKDFLGKGCIIGK